MKKLVAVLAGAVLGAVAPAFATVTYFPVQPNVEQSLSLTVTSPSGLLDPGSPEWDFGDGTTATGPATVTKTYTRAGTFTVTVRYQFAILGTAVPISATESVSVTVVEKRRVVFNPMNPNVDQDILFTAENFFGPGVRWDFGDGTAPVTGPAATTHRFAASGTFTVGARDLNGASVVTFTALVNVGESRRVTFVPPSPLVGQTVTFTAVNFLSGSVQWDFGDGTAPSLLTTVATHAFGWPGTFLVKARDFGGTASAAIPATVVVSVDPARRRITASPPAAYVESPVTFTPVNFYTTSIRWDFGDGMAPSTQSGDVTHTFTFPGTFSVRAWDWNGQYGEPVTTTVTASVDPLRRRITVSPALPAAFRPASFTAVDFYSTDILWDFGDGTAPTMQSTFVSHIYAKPGASVVQAWDWSGRYGNPVSLPIRVLENSGPRAAFQVYFLQLRFGDGKSYTTVPKDSAPFRAFADVKYEGTGLLQVEWLVDGQPFRQTTQALTLAREATIDSGEISALPTQLPGIHEVTLKFIQPQPEFTIPVIRYFVALEAPGRAPAPPAATIVAESVFGLKGVTCSLNMDTIQIPTGGYFLLNGSVKYENEAALKYALLRIHLDNELIDQQLLRGLKKDDERKFTTSVRNPDAKAKKLFISLYDITSSEPKLLYLKSFRILPNVK